MKHGIFNSTSSVWQKNPALQCGFAFFLGCLFALNTVWAALPLICLIEKKEIYKLSFLFFLPSILIYHFYAFPKDGEKIEGLFSIHAMKRSERFGKGWVYSGVLRTDKGRVYCKCFSKSYFSPNAVYKIQGIVKQQKKPFYTLKSAQPWDRVKSRASLAEIRFHAKTKMAEYITRRIKGQRAPLFLTGLATGKLEDRLLFKEFRELGLAHILAISGFHFALIALMFHCFLRLFFPYKLETFLLITLLTFYFLFIGDSPSVLRAWIAAMVYLLGKLVEKRPSALNTLGAALFISLILNPLNALTLSFQLSFLATAGILVLHKPIDYLLRLWLPLLPLSHVIKKNIFWQHGYIAMSLLRQSLSLTLSVNIALLPLLLQSYHAFSMHSLVYNLFFPFLAGVSLCLLLLGFVCGPPVQQLNGLYTEWILKVIESPPLLFKTWYAGPFPGWVLAFFFTAALWICCNKFLIEKKSA